LLRVGENGPLEEARLVVGPVLLDVALPTLGESTHLLVDLVGLFICYLPHLLELSAAMMFLRLVFLLFLLLILFDVILVRKALTLVVEGFG
jgi:hypothetical protein